MKLITSYYLTIIRLLNSAYPGLDSHELLSLSSFFSFEEVAFWLLIGLILHNDLVFGLVEGSTLIVSLCLEVFVVVETTIMTDLRGQ